MNAANATGPKKEIPPRPRPTLSISLPTPPLPTPKRDRSHLVHLFRRHRTWWVQYLLDGQRVRESLRTENRKIAEDLRAEREFKLRNRLLNRPRSIPLDAFMAEYLAFQKMRKSHKGFETDRCYLTRFFEALPVKNLTDLMSASVTQHLTHRREQDSISPKTCNRIRECLHTMFSYALRQGYVAENPISRVPRFREDAREIVFLKKPDIERLLEVFSGDILYAVVATLVYGGLRRSEACWLRWQDVDLGDKPHIRIVPKTVDGIAWQPKTRRPRIVPLSTKLVEILKALPRSGEWVFMSPEGCRWNEDNLTHRFEKKARKASLRWTLLHLRHTFGSALAQRGVSIYKVSKFMGNSVQVCQAHYAALAPEELGADIEF